jgi:hypothetical protein
MPIEPSRITPHVTQHTAGEILAMQYPVDVKHNTTINVTDSYTRMPTPISTEAIVNAEPIDPNADPVDTEYF